jgi:divalent metal cation (Fe/Co/Zn/Cd) transporter
MAGARRHAHEGGARPEHDQGHERDGHRRGHDEHQHDHRGHGDHGHSHGLVDPSIKRSRAGVRAVLVSLAVLGVAAVAQTLVFALSGSVALLADLIHNFGDALTAVPLGIAFIMRSERAERAAGLFVVAAIFISACVAGVEAAQRLIHPAPPTNLGALAAAGAIGYLGNLLASKVRKRAGHRLNSPALIAAPVADPLIGLAITLVILRITWQSWNTVRGRDYRHT